MIYDRHNITEISNCNPEGFFNPFFNFIRTPEFMWQWGTVLPEKGNFKSALQTSWNRHLCRILYQKTDPLYGKDVFEHDLGTSTLSINTQALKLLTPLFKELGIKRGELEKVKLNLAPCKTENAFSGWHNDPPEEKCGKGMTAIYYFNTCDGKTVFKEPYREVFSEKEKMIVFPNEMLHGGTFQTDKAERVVLNINWILDRS